MNMTLLITVLATMPLIAGLAYIFGDSKHSQRAWVPVVSHLDAAARRGLNIK